MSEEPNKLQFHYIKANDFRVVRVDGAHGGPTPRGAIFMAVFSERVPIPELITQVVKDDGNLGEEVTEDRKSRKGIVREVEVGLMMDLPAAESIHTWLGDKIQVLKRLQTPDAGSQ